MKKLLSVVDIPERARLYGTDGGRDLLKQYKLDGFELVYCGDDMNTLAQDKIIGLHLPFYADWVNFWLEDYSFLDEEFGSRAAWIDFYGCESRQDMVNSFQASLRLARELKAEYVVFHVSQVSVDETFTFSARHSDETVISCAIELINAILEPLQSDLESDNSPVPFDFLMENLWWAGFNLRDPELSRRLIDGVNYPSKGFMLDLGHLLCTNQAIRSEDEASEWILQCLDQHRDLLSSFRGLHLHSSLSGSYASAGRSLPYNENAPYAERYAESYYHVEKIDRHEIWNLPRLDEILKMIPVEFLVYEFKYSSLHDLQNKLLKQNLIVTSALQSP